MNNKTHKTDYALSKKELKKLNKELRKVIKWDMKKTMRFLREHREHPI